MPAARRRRARAREVFPGHHIAVDLARIDLRATDASIQLAQIAGEEHQGNLFRPTRGRGGRVVKSYANLGLTQPLIVSYANISDQFAELIRNDLPDRLLGTGVKATVPDLLTDPAERERTLSFAESYKAQTGTRIDQQSLMALGLADTAEAILRSVDRPTTRSQCANSFTPRRSKSFQTIRFSPTSHVGMGTWDLAIVEPEERRMDQGRPMCTEPATRCNNLDINRTGRPSRWTGKRKPPKSGNSAGSAIISRCSPLSPSEPWSDRCCGTKSQLLVVYASAEEVGHSCCVWEGNLPGRHGPAAAHPSLRARDLFHHRRPSEACRSKTHRVGRSQGFDGVSPGRPHPLVRLRGAGNADLFLHGVGRQGLAVDQCANEAVPGVQPSGGGDDTAAATRSERATEPRGDQETLARDRVRDAATRACGMAALVFGAEGDERRE